MMLQEIHASEKKNSALRVLYFGTKNRAGVKLKSIKAKCHEFRDGSQEFAEVYTSRLYRSYESHTIAWPDGTSSTIDDKAMGNAWD